MCLKKNSLIALAAGLAMAGSAAQAATIVVRSNGPSATSYPPGKRLPDGGTIVLKPGDSVTVLDARGTRVLRGNGAVAVSSTGTAAVNGISALIADNGLRQTRTGATRGDVTPPRPTNVWMVDVTRPGPVCVIHPQALALWRPTTDQAASVTIAHGASSAQVAFLTGQAVHGWPVDAVPVIDGQSYVLTGSGAPVTLDIRVLPAVPATLDDTAAALIDHGCTAQLDLLATATATDPN